MSPIKMHSMTFRYLIDWRVEVIRYRTDDTARNGQVPTLFGRDVHVDDREPRNEALEATLQALFEQDKLR
jgi:hypothetical protein